MERTVITSLVLAAALVLPAHSSGQVEDVTSSTGAGLNASWESSTLQRSEFERPDLRSSERSVAETRTTAPAAVAPRLSVALVTDVRNSRQPYAPYNSVGYGYNQGGYDCQLYYHEYSVTQGCGGAWLTAELRGFQKLPNGAQVSGLGRITADFGRTFGCSVQGRFIPKMVLRENDVEVPAVHLSAYFGPGAPEGTRLQFFRSFEPLDFVCAEGVRAQLGLRVSDVRVTITSDQVATIRKTFAGPYYSPPG